MNNLPNTYHANGDVTYWSVYSQQWCTLQASSIPDRDLATMSHQERDEIAYHARETDVTDEQIEALRSEAEQAGDTQMVATCRLALSAERRGQDHARAECAAAIAEARAMDDEEEVQA